MLSSADLEEAIGEIVGAPLLKRAGTGTMSLRLPSTSKAPAHSPELLVEESLESATSLKWWDIETLTFPAGLSLDMLLALPENPPYGMVYGSSLQFWMTVAGFTFELITKQAFIPTLQETKQGRTLLYQAVWKVFLSHENLERLNVLTHTMPPLCWSFMSPGEKKASLLHEVVQTFLDQSVDAFVRESLPSDALVSSRASRKTAPVPELWLRALSSKNSTLSASPEELQQFAKSLAAWLETVQPVSETAPFRTCFRLDTPETDEQAWLISFHLQANDDRSLLVPADDVWQERSDTLTFLHHKFENPQERLLTDLGRASRLFPMLEESLKTAHPRGLALSTEEAYAFLRQSAPLLEQSGFGVLVPPWWSKSSARLKVKLKLKPKSGSAVSLGLVGLDSIVAYDWNAAIGESELTEDEFERLVNLKTPLVHVRGQWVELRPEEIEAAISFFQKKRKRGEMKLGEALGLGLGQGMSETGLQVAEVEGDGWIHDLLDGLTENAKLDAIAVPSTLQGTLRPYQLKGVSWLAFLKQFGLGACLADDMGMGKTIQLITLLLHERERQQKASPLHPTLLICPMSIVGNWQRELQRFAPSLKVMVHHGMERLSGQAFVDEVEKHDVVITTYSLALRDKEHLAPITWEQVVIDEAQNIKNESAKQTQAIKKLDANYKIALTGTPVENRLSELWSIMEFLNPGYLGSGTEFHKNFATPIERHHNAERADTLKRLTQPFILRRLKTDKEIIQDLPDKMEMKVFCNLTQEQASLYEAVVKEMLERIEEADGIERKGLVLATLTKLKQVCNHPAHFMSDGSQLARRSGKLNRLEEMLEEVVAVSDKALIFTQFAEMGGMLRAGLQERLGREVLFLHGGTPKKQRDIMVQRFQEERRGSPLFILSLKAGGVGLNLTAANHVFHFDRWWNPAVENQATDRAFRIGQKKNVQVHKFVCVGTLEERIDQMIEQKKELAESIIGNGENWLTEMSTSQLKELFALSREAVGE
ncbi:MAG: DEAD/DEAH box helicase [Ktedonobacteraceae bacterium]